MKLKTLLEALPPSLPLTERALIERAYAVAKKAHAAQTRASGEPYVDHCLNVALILAEAARCPRGDRRRPAARHG